MELQGKKATHDFLSLYKDSTFPRVDPTPSQQGIFLKTQDLLQPLEGKRKTAAASEVPGAVAPTTGGASSVEHVLPGGIGTFSINHVPGGFAKHAAAVKPECGAGANSSGAAISSGSAPYSRCGAFTLWEEPISREKIGTGGLQQLQPQWSSSPYAARISKSGSSFGSLLSTRSQPGQDRRRPMDAASKSGKGFTDEDDDEEEFGRREGSSQKELTVKVDRKSNSDQKATTPRSKHSATEQRRRSKINDRFQILRELIPHSDQKRDKASFLLEVIEYIRFLHEKVQKYEAGYTAWGHESTKLTPWKNSQVPVEGIPDPSQALHNGPSPSGFVFSGDSAIPVAPVMLTSDHTPLESENVSTGLANKGASIPASLQQYSSGRGFVQPQQRLISDSENVASQSQSQWSRQCSGSGGDVLGEQELTIDEGTISISSAYSQGLLNALTEALQNSGIDLSQSSISVQINLGKRAFNRSVSNPKDQGDPSSGNQAIGHSQMGSTVEEPEQAYKRHKPDKG